MDNQKAITELTEKLAGLLISKDAMLQLYGSPPFLEDHSDEDWYIRQQNLLNEIDKTEKTINAFMAGVNDWPYPHIDYMYQYNPALWHETNENIYWNQLECVPPRALKKGAFAVGEAWTHDDVGSIHAIYMEVKTEYGSRYFCKNDHIRDFNPLNYYKEITSQFGL